MKRQCAGWIEVDSITGFADHDSVGGVVQVRQRVNDRELAKRIKGDTRVLSGIEALVVNRAAQCGRMPVLSAVRGRTHSHRSGKIIVAGDCNARWNDRIDCDRRA